MFSFRSIQDFLDYFRDEQSCIDYWEEVRWQGAVVSPYDPTSKVYRCKNNMYKCKNTGKYFNVRTGTIFEGSKLSLRKWFYAIYVVIGNKKGISSCQLARNINVTQKTAWKMIQKIQMSLNVDITQSLEGEVEVDEAYIGGVERFKHSKKKKKHARGRSLAGKTPVFGMVQRGGFLFAVVVSDTTAKTLLPIINKTVRSGSIIYSDEYKAYRRLDDQRYDHGIVYHKKGAYVIGRRSTNTIEGFWGHLKRVLKSTHHWVSPKHLQKYVNAESFRYNTKHLSDYERFDVFLQNVYHTFTYKELIAS